MCWDIHRIPIPSRPCVCICQPVCKTTSPSICGPLLGCRGSGSGVSRSQRSRQNISCESYTQVSFSCIDLIRVVLTWCSFCQGGEDSALTPFAARISQDLVPLLVVASDDTLSLVLETLSVVLEVDQGQWLTPELVQSLVSAVLEVWSKNNKGQTFGMFKFLSLTRRIL